MCLINLRNNFQYLYSAIKQNEMREKEEKNKIKNFEQIEMKMYEREKRRSNRIIIKNND